MVKQEIRTGPRSDQGYLIISGVTKEDYLAFPYGNGALEGTKTQVNEEMSYYW